MILFNHALIHAGIWMQDAFVCGGKRKPGSEGKTTVAFQNFWSHHDSIISCLAFQLLLGLILTLKVSDELGKRQPRSSTPRRKGWYTKCTTTVYSPAIHGESDRRIEIGIIFVNLLKYGSMGFNHNGGAMVQVTSPG